ncbi:MAG: GNAT family N-acetyltransferase, partial [Candidatus Zixiibacteriota bacterium]
TWEGKTWLEQNRVIARNRDTLDTMLASLDKPYNLRYLRNDAGWNDNRESIDEVGYLFLPESYDYDINQYFERFSHKTAKKLNKELARWNNYKLEWRFDAAEDFEILCQMNRDRYGQLSYFHDERFLNGFHSLLSYLNDHGWLRMVTVIVNDEPAAVDMGSLYNGMLTMLAGGTNANFSGIAKLINMHHITYACENRLDSVDFLCGDFNWKTLFHLTPSPLYLMEGEPIPKIVKSITPGKYLFRSPKDLMTMGAPHV